MAGAYMQFATINAGDPAFILPQGFKTASIIPLGPTVSVYTITPVDVPVASGALVTVTSFPQIDTQGNWGAHSVVCTSGSIQISYFNNNVLNNS